MISGGAESVTPKFIVVELLLMSAENVPDMNSLPVSSHLESKASSSTDRDDKTSNEGRDTRRTYVPSKLPSTTRLAIDPLSQNRVGAGSGIAEIMSSDVNFSLGIAYPSYPPVRVRKIRRPNWIIKSGRHNEYRRVSKILVGYCRVTFIRDGHLSLLDNLECLLVRRKQ